MPEEGSGLNKEGNEVEEDDIPTSGVDSALLDTRGSKSTTSILSIDFFLAWSSSCLWISAFIHWILVQADGEISMIRLNLHSKKNSKVIIDQV